MVVEHRKRTEVIEVKVEGLRLALENASEGWTSSSATMGSRVAVCNESDEEITVTSVTAHFMDGEASETGIGRFNSREHGSPTWRIAPQTTLNLSLDGVWDGTALSSTVMIRGAGGVYPFLVWHSDIGNCVRWADDEEAHDEETHAEGSGDAGGS